MGDENSDEIIMTEIGRGMLSHANTRIAFRQMRALETIAAELQKLALPMLEVGGDRVIQNGQFFSPESGKKD